MENIQRIGDQAIRLSEILVRAATAENETIILECGNDAAKIHQVLKEGASFARETIEAARAESGILIGVGQHTTRIDELLAESLDFTVIALITGTWTPKTDIPSLARAVREEVALVKRWIEKHNNGDAGRPKNGAALNKEQKAFIQGAGHAKKAVEIIQDFQEKFHFSITDRTVRKYRNHKPTRNG